MTHRIPTHDEIAVCAYYNWQLNARAGEPDFINTPLRNWYDAVIFMTEALNPPPPPTE
jgi:hypothetical protein